MFEAELISGDKMQVILSNDFMLRLYTVIVLSMINVIFNTKRVQRRSLVLILRLVKVVCYYPLIVLNNVSLGVTLELEQEQPRLLLQ